MIQWFIEISTIPNLLLMILLGLGLWVFKKAQIDHPTFDIGDMLIGENGKASSSRFAVFIALALTSYLLAYVTINKTVGEQTLMYMYGIYIITWASSKSLERIAESWSGRRVPGRDEQYRLPPLYTGTEIDQSRSIDIRNGINNLDDIGRIDDVNIQVRRSQQRVTPRPSFPDRSEIR